MSARKMVYETGNKRIKPGYIRTFIIFAVKTSDETMTIEFVIRLVVAALLGAVIGIDREYRAKDAGFRTHFLVALGSSLFMILSQYGLDDVRLLGNISLDPSRIAAQVVTGIGFIGAGTIILQKKIVRGLTTAAGLWVTSAIGLACGAGMYVIATVAAVLTLIGLELFGYLQRKVGDRMRKDDTETDNDD